MPGTSAPKKPISLRHWSVFVPLTALAIFVVVFLAHERPPRRTLDIALTPPPQSRLAPIALPARVRSLSGTVVEADGKPAGNALVWLLSGNEPHWAYTDARGAFRLDQLERTDDEWHVRVVAQDHLPLEVSTADQGVIRLPDARRGAPVVSRFERATLAGRVLGAPASVLEGAELVLTPVRPPDEIDAPLPRRTTIAADGSFAFEKLIVGAYQTSVVPAWAAGGSWPDLARPLDGAEPRVIEHRAHDTSGLDVQLSCGDVHGIVSDEAGRTLEGALVLVSPSGRPDRVWPPAGTDGSGAFEIRGLPSGKYALEARAGSTSIAREIEIHAGETTELPPLVARPVAR